MHLKNEGTLIRGDFGRYGERVLDVLLSQDGYPGSDAPDKGERHGTARSSGLLWLARDGDGGAVLVKEL